MKDLDISVRKAQLQDIDGIYQLVMELAIYERAAHEVSINPEYYRASFSDGLYESIVAIHNEVIIGTCVYYSTFSTWKGKMLYLEDFVVRAAYRNRGIGQKLYDTLIEVAKNEDYKLVKWQVLDWNDPAIKFYRKNEAIIEKEWWNCKVII